MSRKRGDGSISGVADFHPANLSFAGQSDFQKTFRLRRNIQRG